MLEALRLLDCEIKVPAKLLLGGGGAMVLAYGFPLVTHDLDALFYKSQLKISDLEKEIHAVAKKLELPKDWLNPYFETFLFTLPKDYETRLKKIFEGNHLTVNALGAEDLLVLKCFAGREKDIPHARALLKKGLDVDFVTNHLETLKKQNLPQAAKAREFLFDLLDELNL